MASFAAALAQGSANTDGEFPLTGTVTVSSTACSVTFPLNILFAGSAFTASVSSISAPVNRRQSPPVQSPALARPSPRDVNIAITGCNPPRLPEAS